MRPQIHCRGREKAVTDSASATYDTALAMILQAFLPSFFSNAYIGTTLVFQQVIGIVKSNPFFSFFFSRTGSERRHCKSDHSVSYPVAPLSLLF